MEQEAPGWVGFVLSWPGHALLAAHEGLHCVHDINVSVLSPTVPGVLWLYLQPVRACLHRM